MKVLSYHEVAQTATDEQFKALTSLTRTEFEELLKVFSGVWKSSRKTTAGRPAHLQSCGDKLLFILYYLKNYPTQEVLGFFFDLDQSQANRWINTLCAVLREALKQEGYLPAREAQQLKEELAKFPPSDLIIDGTERRRQRPKNPEAQTHYYSGKKSAHREKPGDSQ